MSDIIFDCEYCHHQLIVDASGRGLKFPCPECGKVVQAPVSSAGELIQLEQPPFELSPDSCLYEFQCPSCAKGIKVTEAQFKSVIPCPFCSAKVRVPSNSSMLFRVSVMSPIPMDDSEYAEDDVTTVAPSTVTDESPRPHSSTESKIGASLPCVLAESSSGSDSSLKENPSGETQKGIGSELKKRCVLCAVAGLVLLAFFGCLVFGYRHFVTNLNLKKQLNEMIQRDIRSKRLAKYQQIATNKRLEAERKRIFAEAEERKRIEEVELSKRQAAERKQREEYARQVQERRERMARIPQDLHLVERTEREVEPLIKQLQFKEAFDRICGETNKLLTKEGLEKCDILQERVGRIEAFHSNLSHKANGYRLARGKKIDSSNIESLNMSGKNFSWADIYLRRQEIVDDLVSGCVFNEKVLNDLSVQEKNRQILDAATCLSVFYADNLETMSKVKCSLYKVFTSSQEDGDAIARLFPEMHREFKSGRFNLDKEQAKYMVCSSCNGSRLCPTCGGESSSPCTTCKGSGSITKRVLTVCQNCGGKGWITPRRGSMPLMCTLCRKMGKTYGVEPSRCETCKGSGKMNCLTCGGRGDCVTCRGGGR